MSRFQLIPTSHLFLIRDGKILLARRLNTGYEDGNWSVIAGHLDGNESARAAMVREAAEEGGIGINENDLRMVHVMHRKLPDHERVDFFFEAKNWSGEPKIMEPDKCDAMEWFAFDKLPPNVIPYVSSAINHYLKGNYYSEFGFLV